MLPLYEGEETIVELCSGKPLAEIKGLAYRTNEGKVLYNGDREFIKELDAVPFPKYEKFELKKYVFHDIDIDSSRGCPYRCIFCSVEAVTGRKMRVRSAENVVGEIEYWYGRGYRNLGLLQFSWWRTGPKPGSASPGSPVRREWAPRE